MSYARDYRCCEKCHHTLLEPCPDFIACLTEGPRCHECEGSKAKATADAARLQRCDVEKPLFLIGTGTCGVAAGAGDTLEAVEALLSASKIDADVVEVGCVGLCAAEPMMELQLPGRPAVMLGNVMAENVAALIDAVKQGEVTRDVTVIGQRRPSGDVKAWDDIAFVDEHPFFGPQNRWVLKNCGRIDPVSLDEYIAHGGYKAFADAIKTMTREDVCQEVLDSGLRGRGGGGFPTGRKWKFALETSADQKYLICNADEGDPGAFMDRAVIEGDPFRLLEGMALAAYAIGASKAYVYIRAEYPLAITRLEHAIEAIRDFGLLGTNILDSGMSLDIVIKKGAGAFVCGEETALINSIEGKRGMPRPRPPFPAVSGLFGKPTVINNVETLANLPGLFEAGAKAFAAVGTESSKGTKVFALSGNVERTGLVEVEMGTPVRDIIFEIGGGIPNGKKYKGVQIGGPSGGCIPEQHLDIDVDYESLKTVGAMMGSGGLVVMDEDTCMVDVAKFFMDFIQRESCGKCIPCREGTRRILETLNSITSRPRDKDGPESLERFKSIMYMERLANTVRETSLCGLGQTAPNPVLSTLRFFRDEYEQHVYERKCQAGVCVELLTYSINEEKCIGCTACAKKCPVNAIKGAKKSPHYILEAECIGCGACLTTCKFDAVIKE
jgi:NADH:ubiquinone oxidoreductase subunit F (NADH-binding)